MKTQLSRQPKVILTAIMTMPFAMFAIGKDFISRMIQMVEVRALSVGGLKNLSFNSARWCPKEMELLLWAGVPSITIRFSNPAAHSTSQIIQHFMLFGRKRVPSVMLPDK